MAYRFYLDGDQLPVSPSKLVIKISNKNKTINLINDGEVNILKAPGLSDISFDFMIPQTKYPFSRYKNGEMKNAEYYLDKLEALKASKKHFSFLVTRTLPSGELLFNTDHMNVSVEDYTITEDAANGMDIIISVSLKQWKEYGLKTVTIKATSNKTAKTLKTKKVRTSSKTIPKTHKVHSGETLFIIAKKELGDGNKYKQLQKLNKIANPNKLTTGMVIKLG